MLPVVIVKFGSSVLASADEIPIAVDEIYRRLREGARVLAVVSAFAGETNRLLNRARGVLGDEAAPEAVAAFVATGEMQSAALLVGALRGAGVAARLVDPREINLRVAGPTLEADAVSVDTGALQALWETHRRAGPNRAAWPRGIGSFGAFHCGCLRRRVSSRQGRPRRV